MSRLNGSCQECGGAKLTHRSSTFCSSACRAAWNNRRLKRGSEVYDLLMAHRFDRKAAADMGVLAAINRLASIYRQEDLHQRSGRRSWRQPAEVFADRPALKTTTTRIRAGR